MACPSCNSANVAPVWPGEQHDDFSLVQCRGCSLVSTHPWPSDEQLAIAYRSEYYGQRNARFWPPLEKLVRRLRQRRAAELSHLSKPGHVLDIGCGRGWTLAALRDEGWQVRGVELHEHAARHAVDELNIDVDIGGFEPARYEAESFDAIILWHVLEHVRDPLQTLDGIVRLLRPGGVLAVAVPNRASWQARVTRNAWFHLDLPRHLWHFSADQLGDLLHQRGLSIVDQSFTSPEQNPFGWAQSLLNQLGLKHNLLYDLIRSRAAREVQQPWRSHPFQSLASVAVGAMLLPWAFAMLLPEWWFGSGATVEIYARRDK